MKIIDSRVRLRTEPLLRAWTTELKPWYRSYVDLYHMRPRLTELGVEELLTYAAESGVEQMVVSGGEELENAHIAEVARDYPQVIPVAGLRVEGGCLRTLELVQRYHREGFVAINIAPFMEKRDLNDKLYYPLYAYCELIGLPVIMHASIHFWSESSMWHGQPQFVDEIAADFPGLRIIMSHGGNGFGPLVLAVAQRHPNVFLEFSALNPDYMAPEFLRAANTYLKHRCLFGTDYPLVEFDRAVEMWKGALREEVWPLYFHDNVLAALNLSPTDGEPARD